MTKDPPPVTGPSHPQASSENTPKKQRSRIQLRNRALILDAALDVFSQYGYRGATLDQIAQAAGLSKPNILYYFSGKEEIHITLLGGLLATWLDPLKEMNPNGNPQVEIMAYVHRKLDMAIELPRESRLFAGEVIQGAPRIKSHLETELRPMLDLWTRSLTRWMDQGRITRCDPVHLIFSIWATTQHYADFAAQIDVLMPDEDSRAANARAYLDQLFTSLLTPPPPQS